MVLGKRLELGYG